MSGPMGGWTMAWRMADSREERVAEDGASTIADRLQEACGPLVAWKTARNASVVDVERDRHIAILCHWWQEGHNIDTFRVHQLIRDFVLAQNLVCCVPKSPCLPTEEN